MIDLVILGIVVLSSHGYLDNPFGAFSDGIRVHLEGHHSAMFSTSSNGTVAVSEPAVVSDCLICASHKPWFPRIHTSNQVTRKLPQKMFQNNLKNAR